MRDLRSGLHIENLKGQSWILLDLLQPVHMLIYFGTLEKHPAQTRAGFILLLVQWKSILKI